MIGKLMLSLRRQPVTLFHPDSPGVRVTVMRSWFGRLFYSNDFATLGECLRASRMQNK